MNTTGWVLVVCLSGLATGKIIGALLAFTRGHPAYDLAAGLLGALTAGVSLRLARLPDHGAPVPTLVGAFAGAILATWLRRILTWHSEPMPRAADDAATASVAQDRHDVMTTSEGTRLLLRNGRLVVPGTTEVAARTRPRRP